MPLVSGNTAHLIGDYSESISAMTDAVHGSRSFVHCEFYILALDDVTRGFFNALGDAAARAVVVRVLLDYIASGRTSTHRETIAALDRIVHRLVRAEIDRGPTGDRGVRVLTGVSLRRGDALPESPQSILCGEICANTVGCSQKEPDQDECSDPEADVRLPDLS